MTSTPISSAGAVPVGMSARGGWFDSRTVSAHYRALAWTLGAVVVCLLFNGLEKWVAIPLGWLPDDPHYRMFKNPSEIPMRLFGFPHFIVGVMFLVTSRRMRGPRSLYQLAGLVVAAIAICWLFHSVGGESNPLAVLLFYFYFLVHGFRDEVFFYRSYGEMPVEAVATHERIMLVLQALLLGLMLALLVPLTVLYGEFSAKYRHPALQAIFPADWPYTLRFFSMVGPMVAVAGVALWRIARVFPNGLVDLWRVHRPILIVFLTMASLIILPLATGGWTFQVAILLHFVAWYFYAMGRLSEVPRRSPPATGWQWMRTTPRGFSVLHLGLAVIAIVLVAAGTYAYGKTGLLETMFGSKNFYYWTIVHVTLSFFPR